MGHLRASCPKNPRPYPCSSNKYMWCVDAVCTGRGRVNSDGTVAIKHGVSGPNVDCCTPSVSRVCKCKALPSACSANQEKDKGHGMISVNDGSQVIADPVSVNDSYEEN